jgi:Flp pilus assembly pilin Flp
MACQWVSILTRRAQTMTEYALILAAVAIVAVIGYLALGSAITSMVNTIVSCL